MSYTVPVTTEICIFPFHPTVLQILRWTMLILLQFVVTLALWLKFWYSMFPKTTTFKNTLFVKYMM
jgi:hypothetical protein